MKTIFGSRKYHYVARVCIFLITLALVVEMVGCSCGGGGGGGGGGVNYVLTISTTPGGNVTKPGVGTYTYNKGRRVDLLASPNSGYQFRNWTGNVSTIVNPNAASTKITMNGAYSITANFVAVVYNLTISSTAGGSVTPVVGTHTYNASTVVNLLATPGAGYRFDNWTGNVGTVANVTAASTYITMKGNYTITANFKQIPRYTLTIGSYEYYEFYEAGEYWEGGYVQSPGEGTFYYYEGEVVDLVAVSLDPWCHFSRWMGAIGTDTSTIGNVYSPITTITMEDNYIIAAFFVWILEW